MTTSRFEESPPAQSERMLTLLTRVRAYTADACAAKAPESVCESVDVLDRLTEQWFSNMARRNKAEHLRGFLANHAALARKYGCSMTRRVVSYMSSDPDCAPTLERLSAFFQGGDSLCPMADLFEYVCRHRCVDIARLLVPNLPADELARASNWYNDGNRYYVSDVHDGTIVGFDQAMALGGLLIEANRPHCAPSNPESPNCKAIEHVEKQMKVTRERLEYLQSPEFIFGQSCDLVEQIALLDQDIARLKKLARESGSASPVESLRVYLQNKERIAGWLEVNKVKYRKASGKRFDPGKCGRK
jgi:hypothetical protein